MSYFGEFYLDKEKDMVVRLDLQEQAMSFTIFANNHQSDNLIRNFARISGQAVCCRQGRTVITGTIPCYIKGDGKRVYILRLGGTKLANIYSDGTVEVNSIVPAIAKTLMSQTKDYQYSFRETLVKSYVPEQIKLTTDLHTHGNANLSGDILIALAIKHQIRYPLYYIRKLGLQLTAVQQEFLREERQRVEKRMVLTGLAGKHRERKIDDNTFLNFADLILSGLENASQNIQKIRISLSILKDSQAVFTNLEKLYLYRYVFTKGVTSDRPIRLENTELLEDPDIRSYLHRMLEDLKKPDYASLTLYEDTLLWTGREYQKKHIRYVEISDTTLVKKDPSAARMLSQLHHILPLIKKETGVDIRFLAAIRRIPLTLVKDSIVSGSYLTEAMQALKTVAADPYVVGSDFVGEEITDIAQLKGVIRQIVTEVAAKDPDWTIRVHAGENDSLRGNMAKAISLVEDSLLPGQPFPYMRIGHGLYCAPLSSHQGKHLLAKLKAHNVVLEFQLTSNVRLNNIIDLRRHPLKSYLTQGIGCVMGTDGCGLYGTDGIDEQLALANFLRISDDEFRKMKATEDAITQRQARRFAAKSQSLRQALGEKSVEEYYTELLSVPLPDAPELQFEIRSLPTYPVFREQVRELPWDKYPVIIAGGSFGSSGRKALSSADKAFLQTLLNELNPDKVFFVVGHKFTGHEQYIAENNPGFDLYSIIPSLMTQAQIRRLQRAKITGIRISTEAQEMGIYKSFNYEIFERRNSVVFAFDGNSAVANLVQEARNGKGRSGIFIFPGSAMLKAKAASLQGYVTVNPSSREAVERIRLFQENIGTRK